MAIVRRLLVIALVLMLVVLGVVWWLYSSVTHVPEEYAEILAAEEAAAEEFGEEPTETPQEVKSQEMLQRVTTLRNDVRRGGEWHAAFSDDEINGWLAIDLPENHAKRLPQEVSKPRVLIDGEAITLFVQVNAGGVKSVVSLKVQPTIEQPGVITLRILGLRAGTLPFSISGWKSDFERLARENNATLVWEEDSEETTIHFTLPTDPDKFGQVVRVTEIALREGEVYVGGTAKDK